MKGLSRKRKLTKKQKEQRNRGLFGFFIVFLIFLVGYAVGRKDITMQEIKEKLYQISARIEAQIDNIDLPHSSGNQTLENTTQIHILDVGQGSSILFISRDGTSVLVDTGRYDDSEKRIISYLDSYIGLGQELDLLIFTHNDADHIGHGDLVLDYFDVQEVWMNGMDHTTVLYSKVLDAVLASDAKYLEPKMGDVFKRGPFELRVLHPKEDSNQRNQNAESIVTHITFDGFSFMTSGDASFSEEFEIVKKYGDIQADMMLLGHHGAADSTSDIWLNAVNPELAFYQAGVGNTYGHPRPETIERVTEAGIPVYGTDELGTISIFVDKDGVIQVETEK